MIGPALRTSPEVSFQPRRSAPGEPEECGICRCDLDKEGAPSDVSHECLNRRGEKEVSRVEHCFHKQCLLDCLARSVRENLPWFCPLCTGVIIQFQDLSKEEVVRACKTEGEDFVTTAVRIRHWANQCGSPFLSSICDTPILQVVRGNEIERLQELLKNDSQLPLEAELGEAAFIAAQNGFFDCLQALLKSSLRISEADLGRAAVAAVEHRWVGCLREILNSGRDISKADLGRIAIQSVTNGQVSCVQALFQSEFSLKISNEDVKKALSLSVNKMDGSSCLKAILDSNYSNEELLGDFVARSAGLNDVLGLEKVLGSKQKISEIGLGQAIILAVNKGHIASLRVILNSKRSIRRIDLGAAVALATSPSPWYPNLGAAVALAANPSLWDHMGYVMQPPGDRNECLAALFKRNTASGETRLGGALYWAAGSGRDRDLERLFCLKEEIRETDLVEAAIAAAENGQVECLSELRHQFYKRFFGDLLGIVAIQAARNGHVTPLKCLLNDRWRISESDLTTAAAWAAHKGHDSCLEELLKFDNWGIGETASISGFVFHLARQGQYGPLKAVLKRQAISLFSSYAVLIASGAILANYLYQAWLQANVNKGQS